jgi:eukaryotic-like serine/threonine-protein kinase
MSPGGRSVVPLSPLRPADPASVGGYRLTARIGAGGMGVVYLAADGDGRSVAVKLVKAGIAADPDFRARFRREVAAAFAVGGTCTAKVVAADPDAPQPWLATEYVEGPSLAALVGTDGPLDPPTVEALAVGLAEALVAIHRAGVVHRDLKPANVIVSPAGPKVIDFGIATAAEATVVTRSGAIVGSPGYLAPEQVSTGLAGPPADVFGWALTVAFAAGGRPPYGTGQAEVLVYRALFEEPSLDGVPPSLAPFVRAALAKDPAARPTAAALLAGLVPDATDPGEATIRILGERWHPGLPDHRVAAAPRAPGVGDPATAVGVPATLRMPDTDGGPAGERPHPPGASASLRRSFGPPSSEFLGRALPERPPPRRPRPARRWRWLLPAGGAALAAGTVLIALAAGVFGGRGAPSTPAGAGTPTAGPPIAGLATASPGAPVVTPNKDVTGLPSASPTAPPDIPVVGTWRGSYVCSQGTTGLLLTIASLGTDQLTATFSFYPVAENPTVPRGSFTMTGVYRNGQMTLHGDRWVDRPPNYSMVGLTATPGAGSPRLLRGSVTLPGCTTFTVARTP